MHAHIVCSDSLYYTRILNWRGYAFESSRRIDGYPLVSLSNVLGELAHSMYGIEESDRTICQAIAKQMEERRVKRIQDHIISQ